MKKPRKQRRIDRRRFRKLVAEGFLYPDGTPTVSLDLEVSIRETADGWKQTITYRGFLQQRE